MRKIIEAIIAGAVIGYVAYLARSATRDFIRYASISLLPALYTGQGIDEILDSIHNFEFTPEIITQVLGGFIFYLILSGNNKFRPKSALSYLILTVIATTVIYLIPSQA